MASQKEYGDPLIYLRTEIERRRKRYEEIPIEDYFEKVIKDSERIKKGEIPPPPQNAPALLYRALTARAPIHTPAGYLEYPHFTQRNDDLALKGIDRSIYDYTRHISTESRLNTKDLILLIVAPSGAGKSTLIQSTIKGLEEYTDKNEPPPVYAIVGCPINEDPLHVLDDKTREKWKERYGIKVTGKLCPHCFLKSEERLSGKKDMGFDPSKQKLDIDFKVKALQFSHELQRGITKIDPKLSKYSQYMPEVQQAVLGSNRGLLHIAEFFQHPVEFIHTLHDLFRGRLYSSIERERADYNISNLGKVFEYQLDTVIIGDMTTEEWREYEKAPSTASLRERLDVIYITYPLTPSAQLDIINKHISSNIDQPPHFSPGSLKSISEFAVRTRYRRPASSKAITEAQKAALYDDNYAEGFSQSDRKVIETEGKGAKEGLVGISPPAIWKPISRLIGDIMSEAEESGTEHKACFDFVRFKQKLEEGANYIDQISTLTSDDKTQAKKQLQEKAVEYDRWLLKTVEEAFYDDFANRANISLEQYTDEVELYLEPTKVRKNERGEIVPVNLQLLEKIENAFAKSAKIEFAQTDSVAGKITRNKFRNDFFNRNREIVIKKSIPPNIYTPTFEDFPEYRSGFMVGLSELSHDPQTKKILPLDILKMRPPYPEPQAKEMALMKKRLVSSYGFCESCRDKLVQHISNQAQKDDYLKILLS